jgi:hypothetical protein
MSSSGAEPKVSVIIPTYDRPAFLRQAIASVLAQTYPDFEILVVDDGSIGDTRSVVEEMSDPRIRYTWQENAGRSAARNRGLALARGEFIAFLDDDDLYLRDKLSHQAAYLEAHPEVDLVGAGTQLVDAQGRLLRVWRTWEDQPELILPACLWACPLPTCTVLFRRQTLGLLDHWFESALDRAEDTDFFVRLLLAGCRMAWLPEIVSAYRLDKVFARADLPPAVLAQRDKLYAHCYLVGACHAIATGQIGEGQADVAQAVALQPDMVAGHPAPLATTVAAFARGDAAGRPHEFIDAVFDALPPELAHTRGLRSCAHGAFHMQQVFKAHKAGQQAPLSHWLRGVYHDPRWLRNLGTWSILRDALRSQVRSRVQSCGAYR